MSLNRVRGKVLDHVVDTYADLPVSGYMGQVIRTKGFSTSVDGLGKAYQWDGAWVSNSIADLIVEDTAEIRTRNLTGVKQITLNTRGRPSYYLDSADTTSADDDFLVIVDGAGNRWKLDVLRSNMAFAAGIKADGVDDTAALQKYVNWAVQSANPATYAARSPYLGKLPIVDLPPGVIRVDTINIPGSVYFRGTTVGSYAGTILEQKQDGQAILHLAADTDGQSNASVFEGVRFKSGTATSSNISQITADDTKVGINSIYFYRCWFQTPEKYAATVVGDDWRFINCTFDVAAYRFIRLGTATRAAINAKFIGCTYFNFAEWCFEQVNATGTQVLGGKAYTEGGVDSGGTTKQGSFFLNQSNIHARCDTQIDNVQINDVTQIAQTNAPNFKMRNCFGSNIGGAVNVIAIGGGAEMLGYDISDNEFYTTGACTGIDMTGTAVKYSRIKSNTFVSSDGLGVRAVNFPDTRNDDNDFSGNKSHLFLNPNVYTNYPLNNLTARVATAVIDPGIIASDGIYTSVQTYQGARVGDVVVLSATNGTWPTPTGIEVTAIVSGSDAVTLRYTNTTAGGIDPPAHQFFMTIVPAT